MIKTAMTLLAGLALAASAQAGEDYSAKAPAPVPAAAPCLWTWFAGGSVGYLDDMDTEMYTLHVGVEYKCPDSCCSHAIYLEAGYADQDLSGNYLDGQSVPLRIDYDVDINMVPITLNYKFECVLTGNLNWYIGAGAGIAIFNIDVNDGGNKSSADETEFLAQAFTGLVYNFSDAFEAFGGARYLYVTDNDLDNLDVYGDDFFYELGVRFNF